MSIQLHKDGTALAIETDCATEETFVEQFCELLACLIDQQQHAGEWEFHFRAWLPQFVEISNAYRVYKTKVTTRTIFVAGEIPPGEAIHRISSRNGITHKLAPEMAS